MNRLWAPWRKAYIRPKRKTLTGCLFCRLQKSSQDTRHYILTRTPLSYAVLNLYPYNNGHVLVVPNRHVASVGELSEAEKIDWLTLFDRVVEALKKTIHPHGFNAGINLGTVAGAGIPKHLHFHIVPRWEGDTNFMPVLGDTKVVSESLDSVYAVLSAELKGRKRNGEKKKKR